MLSNWRIVAVQNGCTRFYWKVPALGQKRNTGLTYSILAAIYFNIVSLGTYTTIPSFFPHFKSTAEVIFLTAVESGLQVPLDVRERHPFSFVFNLGNKAKSQGLSSVNREDGE
jgi:hypothetical protein